MGLTSILYPQQALGYLLVSEDRVMSQKGPDSWTTLFTYVWATFSLSKGSIQQQLLLGSIR